MLKLLNNGSGFIGKNELRRFKDEESGKDIYASSDVFGNVKLLSPLDTSIAEVVDISLRLFEPDNFNVLKTAFNVVEVSKISFDFDEIDVIISKDMKPVDIVEKYFDDCYSKIIRSRRYPAYNDLIAIDETTKLEFKSQDSKWLWCKFLSSAGVEMAIHSRLWAKTMQNKISSGYKLSNIAASTFDEVTKFVEISGAMSIFCIDILKNIWIYGEELSDWNVKQAPYSLILNK